MDGRAAEELDLELAKRTLALSTRNNTPIVLRSLLRFAVAREYIPGIPVNMPKLKKIGQSLLTIPSDDEVALLLDHAQIVSLELYPPVGRWSSPQ